MRNSSINDIYIYMMRLHYWTLNEMEPQGFEDPLNGPNVERWINVINEGMTLIEANNTWTLVHYEKAKRMPTRA